MLIDIIWTFIISISPVGEARVGIPFGATQGLPIIWAFLIGWIANLLVFPFFYRSISISSKYFWKNRTYKKSAVFLTRRAKNKTSNSISKYGVWGLMVFVMIPLPITGAYIGTLAAYVFKMNYRHALIAVSLGITLSSLIIAIGMHLGMSAL